MMFIDSLLVVVYGRQDTRNTFPESEYRPLIEQLIGMQVYSEMHINNICQLSLRDTQEEFYLRPKGNILVEATQIRWLSEQSGGRLGLKRGNQWHSKLS
jgi:hypothetical protein